MSEVTWKTLPELLEKRRMLLGDWVVPAGIEEIRSGAIIPVGGIGEYKIQANTAKGLRNFRATESPDVDLQSDAGQPSTGAFMDSAALVRDVLTRWKSVTVNISLTVRPGQSALVVTDPPFGKEALTGRREEHSSPEAVLQVLRDPDASLPDRRQAVLQAEVLAFSGNDREEISSSLREFILEHRDSNVPQDLVAVGAAVRKMVAYLPLEDIGTLTELLTPSARVSIPLEVELEVAKTVMRKLTAHPPAVDDSEPELADRLMDVARTYLNPRLLPREKHGATALNAVLSLLLLRSQHSTEIIGLVQATPAPWFTQLMCRRVGRLLADLRHRLTDEVFPVASRSLYEFTERVCL